MTQQSEQPQKPPLAANGVPFELPNGDPVYAGDVLQGRTGDKYRVTGVVTELGQLCLHPLRDGRQITLPHGLLKTSSFAKVQ